MGNFRHTEGRSETTLSQYIWKLKDNNTEYLINWKILARGRGYNQSTKSCRLCLLEKHFIMFEPEGASLNRRTEMFSSCMHRKGLKLGVGVT